MWTFNGERTLPKVLNRINKIVPEEVVNQKLIVDDGSKDNTVAIAKKYGWEVIRNEGKGISAGANTALKHVQTNYFCSFEQDLYLADDWWKKVSLLILDKEKIGAACGIRFLPVNNFCYSVEVYQLTRKDLDFYGGYGKTLDNTIWRTSALRSVGGFPKANLAGIDTIVLHLLESKGYEWMVDYNVKSLHIHPGGTLNEFRHYYFYGLSLPQIYGYLRKLGYYKSENLKSMFTRFLKSPLSSLKMTITTGDPRLIVAYPIIRLCWLLGFVRGRSILPI
jgi:rhamnosyltransferase